MALTLRLPPEDEAALKRLSESYRILQIDLIRMAVGALIESANKNNGRITLPICVINDR